jgi:hypothetical protein
VNERWRIQTEGVSFPEGKLLRWESGMRRPIEDRAMSVEYLLVSYKEDRDVLADGDRVGVTNHTIMLPANQYIITLSGDGYAPPDQTVVLSGTSIVRPKVITFT